MKTDQPVAKRDRAIKPQPPKRPAKPTIPMVQNEKVLNKRQISLEI